MAAGGARRSSTSSITSSINRPVSPISQTESNANIFDDEYATTDYADSIRAPSENYENPFQDPSEPSTTSSNPSERNDISHVTPSLQLRNSIRKSLGGRNATSSSDSSRPLHLSTNSLTMPRRSFSTASSGSYAPRTSSSGRGEPTHPYAMYPQGLSVSRTTSLAAAQRTASLRSSRERFGPAHPYNLYPQDVLPMEAPATNNIPVGFPGHAPHFHRRTGADGEEQDIVGPDGHTEQLPPYTRYPDESTTKTIETGTMPLEDEPAVSTDHLQEVRDRPRRPNEVDNLQIEEQPEPPPPPTNDDQAPLTNAMSEKPPEKKRWNQKTWKEKSKTRICGVLPLWILLLILSMVVIVVIICASFVGSILHEAHKKTKAAEAEMDPAHWSSTTPSATITYYDAAPTATPTYLTPLPTGTFVVPLGAPDYYYGECLGGNQMHAWTCNLPAEQTLCVELSVDQIAGPDRAFLNTCNNHSLPGYGTQPPWLIQQTLKLVTDLDDESLGPAWHFQTFYDKLVILPEWQLPYGTGLVKRDWKSLLPIPHFASSKLAKGSYPGEVKVGDSAWFCHWDDTFIEGFIYATVSNPLPTTTTVTSTAVETTVTTTEYWDSYSSPFAATYSYTTTPDYYIRQANAGPTPSHYSDGSEHLETSQSSFVDRQRRDDTHESPTPYTPTPLPTAKPATASTSMVSEQAETPSQTVSATTSLSLAHNSTFSSSSSTVAPTPVAIPQLVKFEERRLKGLHDTATCNLMQKMPDKRFQVRTDTITGQPIVVALAEDDGPELSAKKKFLNKREPLFKGAVGGGAALEKRQSRYVASQVDETCFCQWTSEQFETK